MTEVIQGGKIPLESHLVVDNVYIELKDIHVEEYRLFIDGIAFISGVNVGDYSDIDYRLIFKSKDHEHTLSLAKGNKPEITEKFSTSKDVSYDKCWFTTFNYKGISLTGLPDGDYELFLYIKAGKDYRVEQKLRASSLVSINESYFHITRDSKKEVIYIDKIAIRSEVDEGQYKKRLHNTKKMMVTESFIDDASNIVNLQGGCVSNCYIQLHGRNNTITFDANSDLKNVFIEILGDDCTVKIGENVKLFGNLRLGWNCDVTIGGNVSSTNPIYLTCSESTKIIIGSDCMFSTNNQIRTDDAHPIYDVYTGNRLNPSKDIILGSHIWIGYGATLFGGSNIGSGSVVGAFSLVNKKFPNNCILAGSPAKIIKKDVFWERSPLLLKSKRIVSFTQEEMSRKPYCQATMDIEP